MAMLSGKLGGLALVAAVALVAGGISIGIYFAIQSFQDGDDDSRVQTVATATAGLPAPTTTTQPDSATPTVQPGSVTPQVIDTSDWLTYRSPLGFTMKYPPTWALEEFDTPRFPPGNVKIFNEKAQQERARRIAEGILEGAESGEAWIEISPLPFPASFDVQVLFDLCGVGNERLQREGHLVQATETSFAGLSAILCVGEGPVAHTRGLRGSTELYFVELPSGRVMSIASHVVDGEEHTLALLRAILATVSFEAAPQAIDTSDWLTHTSPLGFTIQYPPDWTLEVVNENHTRIRNPISLQLVEDLRAQGLVHGAPVPGMAQFNVLMADRAFDVAEQIELCERPPNTDLSQRDAQAQVTTFAGRTAVLCELTSVDPDGLEVTGVGISFEFPAGQRLSAGGGVWGPGDIAILETILSSLKLLEEQ